MIIVPWGMAILSLRRLYLLLMSLQQQNPDSGSDDDLGPPPPMTQSICAAIPGAASLTTSPAQTAAESKNNAASPPAEEQKEQGERRWDCAFTDDVRWSRNKEGQHTVNEYTLLGELGRGSYGKVQLCERRVGDGVKSPWRRFAMKIVSKPRLRRLSEYVNVPGGDGMRKVTAEDKMRQEIEIMRHLYHRSVVLLFEVLEEQEQWEAGGGGEGRVCMIQEYMEGGPTMTFDDGTGLFKRPAASRSGGSGGAGDARERRSAGNAYSEDEAKPIFRDLLQGLLYLHEQGVVHRDIKPDNLLLFENGTLRICDFGCARRVKITRRAKNRSEEGTGGDGGDQETEEDEEGLWNSVGTYAFHCPESVTGDGTPYSGRAADAWAAACTLYCWTFGCLPFHHESLEQLFEKIRSGELDVGQAISPELAALLNGMLEKDPAGRIGLQAALEHSWMKGVPDPPPPAGFVADT